MRCVWLAILGAFLRIARKRRWACCLTALLAITGRLALLPWLPPPDASVHDEFSYLLAADTFASGRVANPTPPMWEHFESPHVLLKPVYASKYPPMQGLLLAAGQKLGHPWIGVLLTVALMAAALCWMLQGWLPPGAAFAGALLIVLRIGILEYWMNSYWGGAAAALGGALLLGAYARLNRAPRLSSAITGAVGLAILSQSRPFEGAMLGVSVVGVLIVHLWRKRPELGIVLRRTVLPVAMILGVTVVAAGYYNHRITGNALRMPYQEHEAQYAVAPLLLFQNMHAVPVYRHKELSMIWAKWDVHVFETVRSHPIAARVVNFHMTQEFFFGSFVFLIPLLALMWPPHGPRIRASAGILAIFALPMLVFEKIWVPHYLAPATGLIYLLFFYGLLKLSRWHPSGKPGGAVAALFIVAIWVFQFGWALRNPSQSLYSRPAFAAQRKQLERSLESRGGRHLVLVRYGDNHDIQKGWISNRADIETAPVIWAREMGEKQDQPLLEYFKDRHAWLLRADEIPPKLVPWDVYNR